MLLSIVLCTARREPGFKNMADSFVNALAVKDPQIGPLEMELIVVDKLLWAMPMDGWTEENVVARRKQLDDAIAGRFSYRHVSPKPSAWQGPYRKTKRDWFSLNNARNTGIALARGQHIVLHDDASVVDEMFLLWHTRAAKRGIGVAGSFASYNWAKVENGIIVDGELNNSQDARGEETVKAPGGWCWGLNTSFPLSWAMKVNGYDEIFDGQGGSEDCDFGVRLERAGCTLVYMPMCLIYQILTNHEAICNMGPGWGAPNPPQKEKLLRDGKMHFANELLIQNLFDDQGRIMPVGNDFDLTELRKEALKTGKFPTERTVTHDWRDGVALEDCV